MDLWTCGPVDLWTCGPVDLQVCRCRCADANVVGAGVKGAK